jgi:hypothetical protein
VVRGTAALLDLPGLGDDRLDSAQPHLARRSLGGEDPLDAALPAKRLPYGVAPVDDHD